MTLKAFASIRFTGDELEPSFVTDILCVRPTVAYAKGEPFLTGTNGKERLGRTGVWLFNTDELVGAEDLLAHIRYVIRLLIEDNNGHLDSSKAFEIINFNRKNKVDFRVSLFWHGSGDESEPEVPQIFYKLIHLLGGNIEIDFDNDAEEPLEAA